MHILLQFVRRTSILNYELPLAHVLILFEVIFLTVARDRASFLTPGFLNIYNWRFSNYIYIDV